MYVDDVEYGKIEPPPEGFQESGKDHQPASQQWLKGTILAPFDEFVSEII